MTESYFLLNGQISLCMVLLGGYLLRLASLNSTGVVVVFFLK